MIYCNECGAPNEDHAKFCRQCGHPLTSPQHPGTTPPPPPSPSVQPAPYEQPPRRGNSSLIIVIVVCALAVIGALVWGFIYLGSDKETDTETTTQTIDWTKTDSIAVEVPAPADSAVAAPAAEPAAKPKPAADPDAFNVKGTIDGYPFTLKGKWRDNEMSGTYINNTNGVKLKFSGYEAEGILFIELSGGGGSFELDDHGNGWFTGDYTTGSGQRKSATLQM